MTAQLYVLGHPVAHSKSPAMHNALYQALGLDWRYDLQDAPAEEDALAFLEKQDFLGINITMPYKPHAFRAAQVQDPSAVLAQGANVLVHEERGLTCYNMDGLGCMAYLKHAGAQIKGAKVTVCGTGPTSLAILHAAAAEDAASATLLGRSAQRTAATLEAYLQRLAQTDHAHLAQATAFAASSYDQADQVIADATVIIDATPLGMKPGDPAPFSTDLLHAGQFVFDAVYGHGETALAAGAKAAGCTFVDGSGMLVGQAVLGAQIFLQAAGQPADFDFGWAFDVMAKGAGFAV
ncbi:MAG: shikimate dehydrogenase [Coriobacteriia bacterium]|nr:shikimate dehydrogenase [Coriobacteriia bacterium]